MTNENIIEKCNNALVIESRGRGPDYIVCRLVKTRKGILKGCYMPCTATPWVLNTVGHCTGEPYSAIWFGEGTFQEEIAEDCPGHNSLQVTKKDLEDYQANIGKRCEEWLRNKYQSEGIKKKVI